jgi:hypothetical protein
VGGGQGVQGRAEGVQQRLHQLQQVPGVHHELQEVRGVPGDRPHYPQAGLQRVHHVLREETEIKSKEKLCKIREERGPPSTYLDNRLERSSSSQSPQGAISLPRSKKETNESQDEEDNNNNKKSKIQEKRSGRKKRSKSIHSIHNIKYNNCTSRTSRGHAYLGGGGVMPGLDGPAGVSSSSPSPPGTVMKVSEELKPPLSRIGVPPIAVTNDGLHAKRHQLHNCTHFEREDDRSRDNFELFEMYNLKPSQA